MGFPVALTGFRSFGLLFLVVDSAYKLSMNHQHRSELVGTPNRDLSSGVPSIMYLISQLLSLVFGNAMGNENAHILARARSVRSFNIFIRSATSIIDYLLTGDGL